MSNSSAWQVGTVLEDAAGKRRVIDRITPPGSAGTRVSDGPIFHARIMTRMDDGTWGRVANGHVADIWSGSLSYATHDFETVPHKD